MDSSSEYTGHVLSPGLLYSPDRVCVCLPLRLESRISSFSSKMQLPLFFIGFGSYLGY